MTERQRGLGRGLSALLGDQPTEVVAVDGSNTPAGVRILPIELIQRNAEQPRTLFPKEELDELAASIAQRGVLQPILVRPHPKEPGQYEIIAGERRWRASQQARLKEVPVVVREMDDAEVFEVAIIENLHRSDLNPIDEAQAYDRLMADGGRSQEEVAELIGKSRSHVANTLRLMQLPPEVLDYVRDNRLSAGHARAIIGLPNAAEVARKAVDEQLSVRQVEQLRQATTGVRPRPAVKAPSGEGSADVVALEQDLSDSLGLKVALLDKDGKGVLSIRYGSLEQLDDLCRRLMRS